MAGWARARQAVVAGVLPVLVAVGLFGLLAGCGHSRDRAVTSTAGAAQNPPGSGATTDPDPARTTPAPTPGQPARPSAGASPEGQSGASAAASAGPATADPSAAGTGEVAIPDVAATSVFIGEPCLPSQDTAPASAINGLTLFCVPATGPAATAGLGAWSDTPPQQKPTGPAPGAECSSSDLGQVQQDSAGRPVTCLREPNGDLRWADIS